MKEKNEKQKIEEKETKKTEKKNQKKYRHFEIISQDEKQAKEIEKKILSLKSEDGKIIENNEIVQGAIIKHDKDTKWDEKKGKYVKTPTNWHLSFSFKNTHTVEQTANIFGVKTTMVEIQHCRVRKQSSKINEANYIAYLMHVTEDPRYGKHFYKLDEIKMFGYDDKENLLRNVKIATIRSIEHEVIESKEIYFNEIETGKISREELMKAKTDFFANPRLFLLYMKYEDRVNQAIGEYLMAQAKKNKNINKQVILITGPSGAGKTFYMKNVLQKKFNVAGYDICESSGNNDVLNKYNGEKVLLIDDCRLSKMNLAFDEILRLTDNHNYSDLSSRYNNKLVSADYIVFTTSQSMDEFFGDVYKGKNKDEDKWQLPRRIQTIINVGYDKISFYSVKSQCSNDDYFDDDKKKTGSFENYYQLQGAVDNPNKEIRQKESEQHNQLIEELMTV